MAPSESRPKAQVVPLIPRGFDADKRGPAEVLRLPELQDALSTAAPGVEAAAQSAPEDALAQNRARAGVLPLPVGPGAQSRTLEPSYRPVLSRSEHLIPGPPPEEAERPVNPVTAGPIEAGIEFRIPTVTVSAMQRPCTMAMAGAQPSLPAEPVAMMVMARSSLDLATATSAILPAVEHFQTVIDVPFDARTAKLADVDDHGNILCPRMPALAPAPVESFWTVSTALEPAAGATAPRLMALGASFDSAVSASMARLDSSSSTAWPSPVPLLMPVAAASPIAVEASVPEVQLPDMAEMPLAPRWSNCPTWPSPVEAFLPPARVPEPLEGALELRLPNFGPATPIQTPASWQMCPPAPSPIPSLLPSAASELLADRPAGATLPMPVAALLPAPALPEAIVPELAAAKLPAFESAFEPAVTLPQANGQVRWIEAVAPAAAAPFGGLAALSIEPRAMRLPDFTLGLEAPASMGMSEYCPDWPGFVAPPVSMLPGALPMPASAAPVQVPGLQSAGDAPSMGASESCPDWPQAVPALAPFAVQPGPFAVSADGSSMRLPGVGRTFEIPSLLTRLRTAAHPSMAMAAPPARPSTAFTPAPISAAPDTVLSLPVTPKSGSYAGSTQGPAPSPVESLPAIAAFAPFRILGKAEMRFPMVPEPQTSGMVAAGTDQNYPAGAAAPEARELKPKVGLLKPLPMLKVEQLAIPDDRPDPAIPRPGFIPIEFYCQRGWVAPCQRLAWVDRTFEPLQMAFSMRTVADKADDPAIWKPTPKAPATREITPVTDIARRRSREKLIGRIIKIAACLVMGVSLWFAAHEVKNAGAPNLRTNLATGAGSRPAGPSTPTPSGGPPSGGGAAAAAPAPGMMANVKQAIANRAAYSVTDTLQTGMESWGTQSKGWAPGWSRNADGYVHPGDLALFRPSMNYKNYRLEFFGQIENKSMGWVVRAQDKQNYYAMKFTVLEAGLRPIIAMAHYPVVAGRKGQKVETPLSVMVHHNTPIHVAVDVQGNRVTASIEGQQVDSWTDDLMPKGGVGFFSDAGERARLYWMKVSKNQDWLGVICSYLSDGGQTRETAEVWGQGIPGDSRAPATPTQPHDVALAEGEDNGTDYHRPHRASIA